MELTSSCLFFYLLGEGAEGHFSVAAMDLSNPESAPSAAEVSANVITLTPMEKIWLMPLKGREESCGKVAKHVIGLGACPRCVFRLLKIKDIKLYREDREVWY